MGMIPRVALNGPGTHMALQDPVTLFNVVITQQIGANYFSSDTCHTHMLLFSC